MSVPIDSTSSASVSWEEFFTDEYLQDWIRLGLQYNSDLRIAQLKVKEAQAALNKAARK
jgi:outer membrane protein TolC